jgi:hypothetical protein
MNGTAVDTTRARSVGACLVATLISVCAAGCGVHSPGVRGTDAGATPDAHMPSPDGAGGDDAPALDAPVEAPRVDAPGDAAPEAAAAADAPPEAGATADAAPEAGAAADAAADGADASAPDTSPPPPPPPPDAGPCVVATGGVLDWDVTAITVTGHLTVNGAATDSATRGNFWLVDSTTGDEALLGDTNTSAYSAAVLPKTYDLVYRYTATTIPTGAPAARHTDRVVRAGVSLAGSTTLDADIQAAAVTGTLTVNGQPLSSGGVTGALWLKSTTSDDSVLLYLSNNTATYSALVAPGTYDLYYRSGSTDSTSTATAHNTDARLQSGIVIAGARTLDIDIPLITVSGQLTVNGALLSTGVGAVVLRGAGYDAATLGLAGSGTSYSARIVPGTYDVYFAFGNTEDPSGRVNQNARLSGPITLSASRANLNFDVPVIPALPVVQIGGAPVPSTDFGSRVELRQPPPITTLGPPDDAIVAFLQQTSFPPAVSIVPGVYDVYLIVIGGATGIPTGPVAVRNQTARVAASLDLTTSGSFTVNVPIVALSGQTSTAAATGGAVALESETQPGDRAEIALAGSGAYQANVIPAVYDLVYGSRAALATGGGVRNTHAVLRRAIDLTGAASASLDAPVPASQLTGRLSTGGIAGGGSGNTHVVLRSADGSDSAHLSPMGTMTYSAWVVPGTYDVYLVNDTPTGGTGYPLNSNARVGCAVVP